MFTLCFKTWTLTRYTGNHLYNIWNMHFWDPHLPGMIQTFLKAKLYTIVYNLVHVSCPVVHHHSTPQAFHAHLKMGAHVKFQKHFWQEKFCSFSTLYGENNSSVGFKKQ